MKYFFNIRDDCGFIPDDEGAEFADLASAREEAKLSARDLAIDSLRGGPPVDGRQIEMANEFGLVLETFLVRNALS